MQDMSKMKSPIKTLIDKRPLFDQKDFSQGGPFTVDVFICFCEEPLTMIQLCTPTDQWLITEPWVKPWTIQS